MQGCVEWKIMTSRFCQYRSIVDLPRFYPARSEVFDGMQRARFPVLAVGTTSGILNADLSPYTGLHARRSISPLGPSGIILSFKHQ